ncbi:unnamed protein product [Cyclocybe aegerita]|uniref:Uncharacterized protein n=1 Tax=Cyclocybe aegerita TaxID=1973307 RepID=A0A8S0VSE8_CYCAE|nr:unnamed protein product [Cyclocybe aegerita]
MCARVTDRAITKDEKDELTPFAPTGPSTKADVPEYDSSNTSDCDVNVPVPVGYTARTATVNARNFVELNSESPFPIEGDAVPGAGMEGRPTDSERKSPILSALKTVGPIEDPPVFHTGLHTSWLVAKNRNNFIPQSQRWTHRMTPSEDLWRPAPAVEVKISKPHGVAQRHDRVKGEVVGAQRLGANETRAGDKANGQENTMANILSGIQSGADKVHRLSFLPLLRRLNSERQSQASKSSSDKENVPRKWRSQVTNKLVIRQPALFMDLSHPKSQANVKCIPTDIWRPAPPAPHVRIASSPSMPYQQPLADLDGTGSSCVRITSRTVPGGDDSPCDTRPPKSLFSS